MEQNKKRCALNYPSNLPSQETSFTSSSFLSLTSLFLSNSAYCCCSVVQTCLTLCDPMDCTPGLSIPHHLPKFAQVHVHCISDAIQQSHPMTSLIQNTDFLLWLAGFLAVFKCPSCFLTFLIVISQFLNSYLMFSLWHNNLEVYKYHSPLSHDIHHDYISSLVLSVFPWSYCLHVTPWSYMPPLSPPPLLHFLAFIWN